MAKEVALAAIKYFDLSHNRKTEIVFTWDKALSFEGNTGPYLQYTHARIHGILRKSTQSGVIPSAAEGSLKFTKSNSQGIPQSDALLRNDTQGLLRLVGLEEKESEEFANLSGGQKQRFTIATSLVHEPKILFLDEPTTGLDPKARRDMWQLIKKINAMIKEYGDLQVAIYNDGACSFEPDFIIEKGFKKDNPETPWGPSENLDDEFLYFR